ncbi:MAG: GrdX family protein [Synergistaceae bacterium]|nr:GrdX family protein [Synergistaceae bacterium]HPR90005.1 GrdX family protein [Synergistaceae bacterium]HRV99456.1 GrdX family protein [Aminobacteriaceae bacterium]
MFCRRMLVTNNPLLNEQISSRDFVEGNSLDVLIRTRNLIHKGWVLLTHPLYGNLRPHQHPYRSILMERASDSSSSVDPLSVEYIENAIAIYSAQSSRILSVEGMPEDVRQDFAFIDADLMKESLSRYRMFIREVSVN